MQPAAEPILFTVLTGFLGSGKTTLLNRLLGDPALRDTAVIINEYGEVAIDHLLVEEATDGIVTLADGCLCCTVRGELVDTLADLVDRLQTGRIERLSRVIVETSGLADPAPVLQAVMGHPVLLAAFRLDGVVTVVDAVNGQASLDSHKEAVAQAAIADRIVLTKTDLAAAGDVAVLRARLERLCPGATVHDAAAGEATAGAVLRAGLGDGDTARWLGMEPHDHHHGHDHGAHDHDHDHDHHHGPHDPRMGSIALAHEAPLPWSAVETFVDLVRGLHGERLLRLKAVVELAEEPERPLVLHGVGRVFHPPARLPAWPPGPRGTRIVLIGTDLDEDHVRRLFAAVSGRPAVDMPDRSALADNPLAIPGIGASRWQ